MGLDVWSGIFKGLGEGFLGAQDLKDKIRREMIEDELRQREAEKYRYEVGRRGIEDEMVDEQRKTNTEYRNQMLQDRMDKEEADRAAGAMLRHLATKVRGGQKSGFLRDHPEEFDTLQIPEKHWRHVFDVVRANDDPEWSYMQRAGAGEGKPELPYDESQADKAIADIGSAEAALKQLSSEKERRMGREFWKPVSGGEYEYNPRGKVVAAMDPNFNPRDLPVDVRAKGYEGMRSEPEFAKLAAAYASQIQRLNMRKEMALKRGDTFTAKIIDDGIKMLMGMAAGKGNKKTGYEPPNESSNIPGGMFDEVDL